MILFKNINFNYIVYIGIITIFMVISLTGCGINGQYQKTGDIDLMQTNIYDTINVESYHYAELYEIAAQIPDEFRKWTIEELGETIVAAGLFWEEWWELNGRFSYEHRTQYDWRETPSVSPPSYQRLLPTSGFNSFNDIRNYLLHYYTETWLDAELSAEIYRGTINFQKIVPFVEYRNILYTYVFRMSLPRPNWNTAVHTLVENDGNYAVVETIVLTGFWDRKMNDEFFWETQHRFTFMNGKIYSNEIIVPLLEQPITWTIEELGETIVTAGMFWEDWLNLRDRFSYEHRNFYNIFTPNTLYTALLPSSGFENLNDIRNFLLQFYTERWVDSVFFTTQPPFIEYDGILYIHDARIAMGSARWETSIHTLIEQDNNHALIQTSVFFTAWCMFPNLTFEGNREEFLEEMLAQVVRGDSCLSLRRIGSPETVNSLFENFLSENTYLIMLIDGRIDSIMNITRGQYTLPWRPL